MEPFPAPLNVFIARDDGQVSSTCPLGVSRTAIILASGPEVALMVRPIAAR